MTLRWTLGGTEEADALFPDERAAAATSGPARTAASSSFT